MDIIRITHFIHGILKMNINIFMKKGSDKEILKNVNEFNNFDLYSKEDDTNIDDKVKNIMII